jgi:hypothetical protein
LFLNDTNRRRVRKPAAISMLLFCRHRQAGVKNLEGPEICVDYSPGYYAFFVEDPDRNKLEICCRESPIIAA